MRDTPLRDQLTDAENHIVARRWLPPAKGAIPHVRIFCYWVNVLWAVPMAAALLVIVIAIAQELRMLPAVQEPIRAYPGAVDVRVYSGFPLWLRLIHFFNLFMMFFHHALRDSNSGRSPAAVFQPKLHARHRMVSVPRRCPAQPCRFGHASWLAGHGARCGCEWRTSSESKW
jgi:hypothetical protein